VGSICIVLLGIYSGVSLLKILKFGWDFTKLYQFNIKQMEMCSFLGHPVLLLPHTWHYWNHATEWDFQKCYLPLHCLSGKSVQLTDRDGQTENMKLRQWTNHAHIRTHTPTGRRTDIHTATVLSSSLETDMLWRLYIHIIYMQIYEQILYTTLQQCTYLQPAFVQKKHSQNCTWILIYWDLNNVIQYSTQ